MAEPLSDRLEHELAEQYLRGIGWSGRFETEIHPRDDMYTVMVGHADYRPHTLGFYYFKSGFDVLITLEHLLTCAGRKWEDLGRVLEFACGYGRFTRFLAQVVEPSRVVSADILEDAPDWVTRHFGVQGRLSATEPAALELGDRFDLIFVGSLFSHLPRARFEAWLARLLELLTPDGLLVFSTHGEALLESGAAPDGFTFQGHSESDVLDPDEYGSTFVRPELVERLARERHATAVYHRERELWNFQDLFAVGRRACPGLEAWTPAPVVRGRIDQVQIEADGRFWIAGWAVDLSGAPLLSVELAVGGRTLAQIPIDQERPDVAATLQRPELARCGWQLEGRIPELPPGASGLIASATSASFARRGFDAIVIG